MKKVTNPKAYVGNQKVTNSKIQLGI